MTFRFLIFFLLTFNLYAASVKRPVLAVVDSWFDKELPLFSGRLFVNVKERLNGIDDDGNGLIDDISGWNFYHKNNHLFEYESQKVFSSDLYRFYELRAKRKIVGLSDQEEAWVKKTYAQQSFKNEVSIFRRYSHGTHVGSIALLGDIQHPLLSQIPTRFKILPIKLFGARLDWDNVNDEEEQHPSHPEDYAHLSVKKRIALVKKKIRSTSRSQGKRTQKAFAYLGHYAQVANCSYGNSYKGMVNSVKEYFSYYFTRKASAEELKSLVDYYAKNLEAQLSRAVSLAPHTLFIFSAGNSGIDNDQYYHFPSNLMADNVMAVASTYKDERIGVKSNYGKKSVDVAAPGIAVTGIIPNGEEVKMSGTSQAAPYVSHIAIRIVESWNRRGVTLTPKQLKYTLLKMVEKKSFLRGKVVSEGMPSLRKFAEVID